MRPLVLEEYLENHEWYCRSWEDGEGDCNCSVKEAREALAKLRSELARLRKVEEAAGKLERALWSIHPQNDDSKGYSVTITIASHLWGLADNLRTALDEAEKAQP